MRISTFFAVVGAVEVLLYAYVMKTLREVQAEESQAAEMSKIGPFGNFGQAS